MEFCALKDKGKVSEEGVSTEELRKCNAASDKRVKTGEATKTGSCKTVNIRHVRFVCKQLHVL